MTPEQAIELLRQYAMNGTVTNTRQAVAEQVMQIQESVKTLKEALAPPSPAA